MNSVLKRNYKYLQYIKYVFDRRLNKNEIRWLQKDEKTNNHLNFVDLLNVQKNSWYVEIVDSMEKKWNN